MLYKGKIIEVGRRMRSGRRRNPVVASSSCRARARPITDESEEFVRFVSR